MGGIVGGVVLDDDLFWVTQFQRKGLGSAKRGLDGTVAISSLVTPGSAVQQIHRFKFTWVTRTQLQAMRNVYRNGQPFTIVTSTSGGHSISNCLPLPFEDDGFTYEPIVGSTPEFYSYDAVEGGAIDLFNGELKVYAAV